MFQKLLAWAYRLPWLGETIKQFMSYSLVGVINTLVGYGTIFLAMAFGVSAYVSNMLGYGLGLCCSFILNRQWVFRAKGALWPQIARFFGSFLVAYGCNFVTLMMLIKSGLNEYLAQIGASVVYVLVMFVITKLWVFGGVRHG